MRTSKPINWLRQFGWMMAGLCCLVITATASATPISFEIAGSPASADLFDPKYNVTATNKTGMAVFDYEIRFIGSGGMIANPSFIKNDGPGNATIKVSAGKDGVDVLWDGMGLGNNKLVSFSFDGPAGLVLNTATWTDLGMKGSGMTANAVADTTFAAVPEPASLSGLAAALLCMAILGLWQRARRGVPIPGGVDHRFPI